MRVRQFKASQWRAENAITYIYASLRRNIAVSMLRDKRLSAETTGGVATLLNLPDPHGACVGGLAGSHPKGARGL